MWMLLWYCLVFICVIAMLLDASENNQAAKAHKKATDDAMKLQREIIKWGE